LFADGLLRMGFQGKDGQTVPHMSAEWINEISERYIELYEKVAGEKFVKNPLDNIAARIEKNVTHALANIKE
jgi:phosphoribosylaminoimidazole-succinocarboxamide synthase